MEFPSSDPVYSASDHPQLAGEVTQAFLLAEPTMMRAGDDYFTDAFCGLQTDNHVYQHTQFPTFSYYRDTLMRTSLGNGPDQLPMLTSPDPSGSTTCGFHDDGYTNQSPLPTATLLDPWSAAEPNMVGAPYLPEQTQTFGTQAMLGMTATPVGMDQTSSMNNIDNRPFKFLVVQTPESLEATAFAPLTRHGHPKPSVRPKHSEPFDVGVTWMRPEAAGPRRVHDGHHVYKQPNRGRYHHTTANDFNNKPISRNSGSYF